ncbi:MAG TPA: hypothetical protein PKI14_11365 [Fervidobacterium sp.]|nr:hypothetical protein [Fervidobacterium sp.]
MLHQTKLIDKSDIQLIRAISDNVPADRLEPYIIEAQEVDLCGLLGTELFEKLFEEVVPNTFPATYVYADLKPEYSTYLAYMAYARFLTQQQVVVTSHGVVGKKTDWSEPVSDTAMQRTIQAARSTAQVYSDRLIKFLNENVETYPQWKKCVHCEIETGNNKGRASISAVKGKPSAWRLR